MLLINLHRESRAWRAGLVLLEADDFRESIHSRDRQDGFMLKAPYAGGAAQRGSRIAGSHGLT